MKCETTPLQITDTQRVNLRLLADGLEANKSRIAFDMRYYNAENDGLHKAECGTFGCIIGNAQHLGIDEFKPLTTDNGWLDYSNRLFAPRGCLWRWLFGNSWGWADNTIKGAVARIRWTLENGLPRNWHDQMRGRADLCYMEGKA